MQRNADICAPKEQSDQGLHFFPHFIFIFWMYHCLAKIQHQSGETPWSGPAIIKIFSCSTLFFLAHKVKMPTMVGILTFVNRKNSTYTISQALALTNFSVPIHDVDKQRLKFDCTNLQKFDCTNWQAGLSLCILHYL